MAAINKMLIYYFSGTGNAKMVSQWIAEYLIQEDTWCELINISEINRKDIPIPDKNTAIAFISPVHGFNYPPIMMHFIMRFPRSTNKVHLLNTRAGMRIGRFITPGLSGISLLLSALFLIIKGYSIRSLFPVDMPSNWISVHPGLTNKATHFIVEKNKDRIVNYCKNILRNKAQYRGLKELIQDLAIGPVSLLYYFVGRFFFAKSFIASSNCNNCNKCIKQCPVKAIRTIDNRPFWTFSCESCMQCMSSCPKKAIEAGHGSIIGFSLLFTGFTGIIYALTSTPTFFVKNHWILNIIEPGLMLLMLAFWYRIIHLAMRYRIIQKIVTYTSLTKFSFWGRRYNAKDAIRRNKLILSEKS